MRGLEDLRHPPFDAERDRIVKGDLGEVITRASGRALERMHRQRVVALAPSRSTWLIQDAR